jgi:hypothetical protein
MFYIILEIFIFFYFLRFFFENDEFLSNNLIMHKDYLKFIVAYYYSLMLILKII